MGEQEEQLREVVRKILEYDIEKLIRRPEWGAISFEDSRTALERIFRIANHLNGLPIEELPINVLNDGRNALTSTHSVLQELDSFTIEQGNPTAQRNELHNKVVQEAERLTTAVSPWIPYLAYTRGDVEENIVALTAAVDQAKGLISGAEDYATEKKEEIDKSVVAAREASAAAGAAVFTHDFRDEADRLSTEATTWLRVAAGIAVGAIAIALIIVFAPIEGNSAELISQTTARLAILAIAVGAALWCGRVYKALLHQSSVNRHRALSLQTFQAFSQAAANDEARDAVLLEATRAIFGPGATGFLEGESDVGGYQIVEVARRILGGGE